MCKLVLFVLWKVNVSTFSCECRSSYILFILEYIVKFVFLYKEKKNGKRISMTLKGNTFKAEKKMCSLKV